MSEGLCSQPWEMNPSTKKKAISGLLVVFEWDHLSFTNFQPNLHSLVYSCSRKKSNLQIEKAEDTIINLIFM